MIFFTTSRIVLGYRWYAHRILSVSRYLLDSVTQRIHLSSTRSSSRILYSEENSASKKKMEGWAHPARQLVSSAARITGSGYPLGKTKRVEQRFLRDSDWWRHASKEGVNLSFSARLHARHFLVIFLRCISYILRNERSTCRHSVFIDTLLNVNAVK